METYKLSILTKKLYDSKLSLMNSRTLNTILGINNEQTFFRIIAGLKKDNIIRKVERDKYQINHQAVDDFEMANFLYEPSYVSLETALNYWGILSQFPFEITCVTNKKSVVKKLDDKIFAYHHLSPKLYGMFYKVKNSLIASPEKALFDQLYFASKGLGTVNNDEYDLSKVNRKNFLNLCNQLRANKGMMKLVGELKWLC
jgi:predicted transcriptional regulator of viral defense system